MRKRIRLVFTSAGSGVLALAALAHAQPGVTSFSASSPNASPPQLPSSAEPAPPNASDMQAVLDAQQALGPRPIETLKPAEARRQPTPAMAVMEVMRSKGMPAGPDPAVATRTLSYGSDAQQTARIYMPAALQGAGPLPVVVYYHGGGWVIGDVQTYDATPRVLAKKLNAIVVSVEYRHAPEHKFPAQHEDAVAAYQWVLQNAQGWGGDPHRIALAGESAGGNLAVATAIYARDHQLAMPVAILSVYPIANSAVNLPSKTENQTTKPLDTPMLSWFSYYYGHTAANLQDPRINLVAADLHGLPPTTIINAQNDPLRSDGETLAIAMQAAGDPVERRVYPGVTHEFFGMGRVVRAAYDAETYSVQRLQTTFSTAR